MTNQYPVIIADPPWHYEVYSNKGNAKSAVNHYSVMDTAAIMGMPVANVAAEPIRNHAYYLLKATQNAAMLALAN